MCTVTSVRFLIDLCRSYEQLKIPICAQAVVEHSGCLFEIRHRKTTEIQRISVKNRDFLFEAMNTTSYSGHMFCVLLMLFAVLVKIEANSVSCYARDYNHRVSRDGCTTKHVAVKACLGTCFSREIPIDFYPFFKKECDCCQPTAQEYVYVKLTCGSSSITVKVTSAKRCECKDCGRFQP